MKLDHRRSHAFLRRLGIQTASAIPLSVLCLALQPSCSDSDGADEEADSSPDSGGGGNTWSGGNSQGSASAGEEGGTGNESDPGEDGGADDDSGDGSLEDGGLQDDCLDDEEYFEEQVLREVLGKRCEVCHNPSGAAKDSDLVLVGSWWGPTYIAENQRIVSEVALNERDGTSMLLLKPTAQVDHGGAKQMEEDEADYAVLEEFIRRLAEPDSHGCPDDDDQNLAKAFEGVEQLDGAATLRRAAILLQARLPTDSESAEAQAGDDGLRRALSRYLDGDEFYNWLTVTFNDLLLTDRYLPGSDAINLLDGDDYPNRRWYDEIEDGSERGRMRRYANEAVAREAVELMVHIIREGRPFTEILTADYTLVNPFSAQVYGVSPSFSNPNDPSEFVQVSLPGIPHAGVLTSSMFMNRFPTTDTNRNRHRSRQVYGFFLGTNVLTLASRPIDTSSIEDHNPTMNNPNCSICHSIIDPVGGTLANWDARGRYRPPEEGWYPELRPPGFNDTVMPATEKQAGARWLARQIVKDRRFAISMVQLAHRAVIGRAPLLLPSDSEATDYAAQLEAYKIQAASFEAIADAFVADNYNFRTVLIEMLASPYFRAAGNSELSGAQARIFDDLGTARFLSPELLDRKLRAVTGYPWRRNVDYDDYLLSSNWFRIYYGGIDSDTVVERIDEPNGLMSNVAERMANEMACWAVPRDFSLPAAERRLFPAIEVGFVPEDDNGFEIPSAVAAIRQNLVHLHRRVLGEELRTDDPKIDIAYNLFLEVWRDGQRGLLNEEDGYSESLSWQCRSTSNFWDGMELPEDRHVTRDPDYTIRAWMAIMTYLLSDYNFLYD